MDSAVEKAGLSAEGCRLAADQQYRQAADWLLVHWWEASHSACSCLPGNPS